MLATRWCAQFPPSGTPTPTGLLSEVQRASLTITPGSVCDHAECSRAAAAGFSHCCKECASWGPKFHTAECTQECDVAARPPAVPSMDDENSRRFKKLSWLGRGAFGVTRKMEDSKTGLVVAMKTITCNGLSEVSRALAHIAERACVRACVRQRRRRRAWEKRGVSTLLTHPARCRGKCFG